MTTTDKLSDEARRHALALEQCSIFAADVGEDIAKAMTDAAAYIRRASQAAPAPVAWANIRSHDGVMVGLSEEKPDNWLNPVPLYRAPAPSGGLRAEAAEAELMAARATITVSQQGWSDLIDLCEDSGWSDAWAKEERGRCPITTDAALTARLDAEWNEAVTEAYQACLTCDGALNNAGAAAMKVRALRRSTSEAQEG